MSCRHHGRRHGIGLVIDGIRRSAVMGSVRTSLIVEVQPMAFASSKSVNDALSPQWISSHSASDTICCFGGGGGQSRASSLTK
jgi:hypothetical protein